MRKVEQRLPGGTILVAIDIGEAVTAPPGKHLEADALNGGSLTLLPANIEGEPLTTRLRDGVTLEAFVPGLASRIEPGPPLLSRNGTGSSSRARVPDPVRNYVIRQVIAIVEPRQPSARPWPTDRALDRWPLARGASSARSSLGQDAANRRVAEVGDDDAATTASPLMLWGLVEIRDRLPHRLKPRRSLFVT